MEVLKMKVLSLLFALLFSSTAFAANSLNFGSQGTHSSSIVYIYRNDGDPKPKGFAGPGYFDFRVLVDDRDGAKGATIIDRVIIGSHPWTLMDIKMLGKLNTLSLENVKGTKMKRKPGVTKQVIFDFPGGVDLSEKELDLIALRKTSGGDLLDPDNVEYEVVLWSKVKASDIFSLERTTWDKVISENPKE